MCIEIYSCNQLSLLHALLNPSLAGCLPCVEDYWPTDQSWQVPNSSRAHDCASETLVGNSGPQVPVMQVKEKRSS